MNHKSLQTGRVKQKTKTRATILEAAKNLLKTSKKVSLDEVAKKAGISRATIYRYYSNIDLLITEASLDIHHITPDQLYEDVKEMSLTDKVLHIQKHYNQLAQDHEIVFRRYLSAVLSESITSKGKLRGARRVESLNKILRQSPSMVSQKDQEKLVCILSVLMGIDALIVCKDVCDIKNDEVNEVLHWGVEMILKGAGLDKS